MALSELDIELVQKYLGKSISSKDKLLFDQKLSNPEFRKELEFQAKAVDALAVIDKKRLKEYLEGPEDLPLEKEQTKSKKSLLIGFLLGLGLVALLYFLSNNVLNNSSNHVQMAEMNDEPYPVLQYGRGGDSKEETINLIHSYEEGDYRKVVSHYNNLSEPSLELQMLRANSHIQLKEYSLAIPLLESLKGKGDKLFDQNVEWYLGISKMGNGDIDQAKQTFERITSDTSHLFYKRAARLLKELSS